jgi:hypothetical protein
MGELKHFSSITLSLTFPPVDLIRFFNPKFGFCWLRSYYKKAYKVGHYWKLVHGGEYSLKRRGSLGHNIRNIQIRGKKKQKSSVLNMLIPSFSSKRGHLTKKHVLIGCKHDMVRRQTFEVWRAFEQAKFC